MVCRCSPEKSDFSDALRTLAWLLSDRPGMSEEEQGEEEESGTSFIEMIKEVDVIQDIVGMKPNGTTTVRPSFSQRNTSS